ncbi:MAG TPA: glucokinase [Vicinamibacterales bacterium]|nr:glucokinase [Vicinamibacterales bacterium]
MILAGDVGGTKTLLGLFDPRTERPHRVHVREFATTGFAGLTEMVRQFMDDHAVSQAAISAACFGVAGPILGSTAELTNVPFTIDAFAVSRTFAVPQVKLLNDLEAMAYAVPVLEGDELHVLQRGEAIRGGNIALIAAGTGLGQALLHNVGGRFIPSPTEAGHADWAPRTERDIALLRLLIARYGRAEVEHVVSGVGLPNVHRAAHPVACSAGIDADDPGTPAALTRAALERRCAHCVEALEMFVDAYGAEAGNAALRSVATAGVFIGGGIAPKILPALTDGRFLAAFRDKGAMRKLVEQVPVKIILNAEAGLLGAAVHAADLV